MKILISAYNINSGGGKVLLESLLESSGDNELTIFSDERFRPHSTKFTNAKTNFVFVKNTLFNRILAEWKMSGISTQFHKHLCLGNLPPVFKSRSKVVVFLHSRYLVDTPVFHVPLRKKLITLIERTWLRMFLKKEHLLIVQTPTMQLLAQKELPGITIKQMAFMPLPKASHPLATVTEKSFLYVASFDPHKNFERLIEAWNLLKKSQATPKLTLVMSHQPPMKFKDKIKLLNIDLKVGITRDQLFSEYQSHSCLIHPSIFESLGMVLLEARGFGLDIIAPEADYVRDVVDPVETFDPFSELSISRAVLRYLNKKNALLKIEEPAEFWKVLAQ